MACKLPDAGVTFTVTATGVPTGRSGSSGLGSSTTSSNSSKTKWLGSGMHKPMGVEQEGPWDNQEEESRAQECPGGLWVNFFLLFFKKIFLFHLFDSLDRTQMLQNVLYWRWPNLLNLQGLLIKVLRPSRHGSGGPQGATEPLEETYILNPELRLDVDMKLCRLWENLVLLMLLFSHWSHNERVRQVDTHVQQVDTTTQEQGGQKLYNVYILDTTCINHVTSYIFCHGALHGCSTMSLTLCFQRLFLLSF